jgi:pimeloyl-ACP methyl ester carboxylesterase
MLPQRTAENSEKTLKVVFAGKVLAAEGNGGIMTRGWVFTAIALISGACSSTPAPVGEAPQPSLVAAAESTALSTPTGDIQATIQLPAATPPVPVVLIISGSGPTDRNGNSPAIPGSNNSLKMLAEGLAERGIASLRYDKRGIAASRAAAGNEADLRFTNYIDDAAEWIRKLRGDSRFSTVTVVGHSEGSLIGMVAAKNAGADAFVSLEGAGRKPAEILIEQLNGQLSPEMMTRVTHVLSDLSAGKTPDSVPRELYALFRPSVQPYMMSWFQYDPAVEIGKLAIPTLIVQGSTDIQTSMTDANALAAGNPAARLFVVEGMNHILKEASGGRMEQLKVYSDPALPVVPRLIDEIETFVKGVKRAPE